MGKFDPSDIGAKIPILGWKILAFKLNSSELGVIPLSIGFSCDAAPAVTHFVLLLFFFFLLRFSNISITRKPLDGFCSNFQRLITSMLSITTKGFEFVVFGYFNFFLTRFRLFSRFRFLLLRTFHNSKTLR